ncbi:tetratricopeptide repeat-containing sensor histidine kinase [Flavobacterium wongokense]|uniref:tetratricopeptide repeat-containing sensor histidine kinase n=1 Tax=Flavobacterium wongokense TaxID=2910674 RepID=UPI001F334F96|nr:tetratricopeptide repeat protein [Flavobacterium sp. WG47]MCF6130715.1 tetratricopeptide repeat protein [Flavobacterium sp. WG47]
MKTAFKIILYSFLLFIGHTVWSQQTVIDSLKRVYKVAKTDTAKVNIYNQLAFELKESYTDSSFYYASKAEVFARKIKYNDGLANAAINKGNANIIVGDYPEAKKQFAKAKAIFESLLKDDEDNKTYIYGLARCYSSLGVIFSQEGNYYESLDNYQNGLKLYQKINNKVSISKSYNNIGIIYKSRGNNAKALEYFKKALKIQEEIGEQTMPVTLTNIGVIYFEDNKLPQAYSYYSKAEKLFKTIENTRGSALLQNYWGDYYIKKSEPAKAEAYYKKALEMYQSIQNKFGASLALYNLGTLYFNQGKYAQAMPLASQSLEYANEIGALDQIYHSEKLVSDLYNIQNQPDLALQHYKNYVIARDSLNTMESTKKFDRAEMDFEYQKKEALFQEKNKRQNLLLVFSIVGTLLVIGLIFLLINRQQVKRRLTLQKEVAEYEQKALHLQMNPHFVFNCLGSISSFIVQNGTDSALKYLSKFSKLMRLTLEYSKDPLIPIDKEIESLQNYLELEQLRFHDKFDFRIASSEKVEFNMGLPPLLIQPFVENAILHGLVPKEGNGVIYVDFDVENGQLVCTISDNGIGITKSAAIKENSMKAHKSMALEITRKRLEIMEATISKSAQIDIRELEENNTVVGTRVTLRLPIQYIQ